MYDNRITRNDILAHNLDWSDSDRATVRTVLDLAAERTEYAYRTQTYLALRPTEGAPRVPVYFGRNSVAVDSEIPLPADLEARAVPETHHNGQYLQILLSTSRLRDS